jgi:hypothetical protein
VELETGTDEVEWRNEARGSDEEEEEEEAEEEGAGAGEGVDEGGVKMSNGDVEGAEEVTVLVLTCSPPNKSPFELTEDEGGA